MVRPMQERAVQTRKLILRAAAESFDESGYHGAQITGILGRAGLTQGAMYFHFKSKEDLARTVMLEQAADLRLPERPAGLKQLVEITLTLAVEMQRNVLFRAGVRLAVDLEGPAVRDSSIYRWWTDRFNDELVEAHRKGELLPHVNGGELAEMLVGAYTGIQLMSQITSGRKDLPRRITSIWRYLLPGIATPEALAGITLADGGTEARP